MGMGLMVMVSVRGWLQYTIAYLFPLPKRKKKLKFTMTLVKRFLTKYF